MPQVVYRLVGDTSDLEAKLDGVESALRGVGKSATTTERKLKKSTDTGSKGAKKLQTGLVSLKEGAEGFGGEMGAVAGRVDKFAKSAAAAGTALGPWGMAVAGLTLGLGAMAWGVTAVTSAVIDFVDGAGAMVDRLDEIAGIDPVPDETLVQLSEFDQMMLAAEASAKQLQVILAGDLAVALTDVGWALVGVAGVLSDFHAKLVENKDATAELVGKMDAWVQRIVPMVGLMDKLKGAAGGAFREMVDGAKEAHKELDDLAEKEIEIEPEIIEFGPDLGTGDLWADNEKRRTEARKEGAAARAAIDKEEARRAAWLNKEHERLAQDSARETVDAWKGAYSELEAVLGEISKAAEQAAAEMLAKQEMIADGIRDSIVEALSAAADLWEHFTAIGMERDQERYERQKEIQEESWGGFKNHLDRIESLEEQLSHERDADRRKQLQDEIDAQQKQVDAEKEANKERRKEAKKAAKEAHKEMVKAFRANKAAQISAVIIDGAAAYMGLLAAFAPAGAFAPALAAGITGPAVFASVAKIAAEKPPKLHDGIGAVDEMLATLRSGEAVLNQRGAQAAGGSQAIEAMNRGTPPGPTTLVFSYAGRAVERVVLDAMQRGGPLQAAMAGGPAGVANPYGSK